MASLNPLIFLSPQNQGPEQRGNGYSAKWLVLIKSNGRSLGSNLTRFGLDSLDFNALTDFDSSTILSAVRFCVFNYHIYINILDAS